MQSRVSLGPGKFHVVVLVNKGETTLCKFHEVSEGAEVDVI